MERKQKECDPTYHHYFALEPMLDEKTGAVTIVLVCTNCSKPVRYDFNIFNTEPFKIIE